MNTSAESIATALGGRKVGNGWVARCPAHHDRKPSLSISDADDGKVLVCCRAGCTQNAVITALRQSGLWPEKGPRRFCYSAIHTPVAIEPDREENERKKNALKIWQATKPPYGTVVEKYLASRSLDLPWLETIRFHPGLKHQSGGIWPAMVALVTHGVDDSPMAIHRTFLARDGSGKAPIHPQRMMLGPCRGGAVRLAPAGDVLLLGEGIETSLAAMQATGHPAWAALSTSGLVALDLPQDVREVIILADGDEAGRIAARDAAERWRREQRRVRVAYAPQGTDFNDVLMGKAPSTGGTKQ